VTLGRAAVAVLGATFPVAVALVMAGTPIHAGQEFSVDMGEPEGIGGKTEYPFKCLLGEHVFANARVFVKDGGELFLVGLDDGFKGYSTRDDRPYDEAAQDFCNRVLQRKRGGS